MCATDVHEVRSPRRAAAGLACPAAWGFGAGGAAGCGALAWRGSHAGGSLPADRAGEGGTDERDQEHGHEAGDDAQPLRPAKPATWFSGSRRRTGA